MKIEIYRDVDEKPDPIPEPKVDPKNDDPKPIKKNNAGLLIAIIVIAAIVIATILYFYGKAKKAE